MTAQGPPARQGANKAAGGRGVSPARSSAFEILRRVEEEGAFASVLLAADDVEIRPADRALRYELVMGVLRWQLWLDALIEHYAGRKPENLDRAVRRALRIALYELRFLSRIPASATVNEAVNLTYAARLRSAAGFVNAVLRRATREPAYDPAVEVTNPIERLSVATSHPVWLVERWLRLLGTEETERFLQANNMAPPVAFRFTSRCKDEKSLLGELKDAGASISESTIAPRAWRVEGANETVRRLTREGLIYLQDEASQLVGHAVEARVNDRILDVCAAPGSKTTHIASIARGVSIVAGDLYNHRLRTLVETADHVAATGINTLVHDATSNLPFQDSTFDSVLVDAPCSGTGTLRRNPEIRWRISPQDIADLAVLQSRILDNSARVLKNGGRLVYSTCSVEPEENEEVVKTFLRAHKEFSQVAIESKAELHTPDGAARTWPHRDGSDGFFIAAFIKCD